jgi:hypothetical protein
MNPLKVDTRRTSVLLSIQRALLGEVRPTLRCVTVGWDSDSIRILCYFDGEISEDDRESMECVLTEVIASFPPSEGDRIQLDCVRRDAPGPIDFLKSTVYRRHESILSP